jgi:hypothetical protein
MNSATIILWLIAGVLLLFSWKDGTETVKRGGDPRLGNNQAKCLADTPGIYNCGICKYPIAR